MNDNMKLVIKALRSGEYTQTKEMLQDEQGYCCLGVMCAVYEKETGFTLDRRNTDACIYGGELNDQEGVQEWVGLKYGDGTSMNNPTLTDLNDSNDYTFSEIADFIESEPLGLLVK
jgi:hypothetical protein